MISYRGGNCKKSTEIPLVAVGGFNPFFKICDRQIGSFPQVVIMKNVAWSHLRRIPFCQAFLLLWSFPLPIGEPGGPLRNPRAPHPPCPLEAIKAADPSGLKKWAAWTPSKLRVVYCTVFAAVFDPSTIAPESNDKFWHQMANGANQPITFSPDRIQWAGLFGDDLGITTVGWGPKHEAKKSWKIKLNSWRF